MKRLTTVLVLTIGAFALGCGNEGGKGDLCDETVDCDEGLVCLSQVLNCSTEDCWGTCEQECIDGSECDGGDQCIQHVGMRICRPVEYEDPHD